MQVILTLLQELKETGYACGDPAYKDLLMKEKKKPFSELF
jgi:hypothetical protein